MKVSTSSFKHLPNLKLVEPTFNTPSGIDMLIGAEFYETVMLDARIKENLQIGDIVFLKDDNTSPMMSPLAKVIKVFDGNDQIARVVEIRTRRGSYVRPVHRLSLFLPAEVWKQPRNQSVTNSSTKKKLAALDQ